MPKRPVPAIPPEAELIADVLAALDMAGIAGLPASKVVKGAASLKQAQRAALQRLEQGGLAVEHRSGKKVLWFAARHAPSVELALNCLLTMAVPRGAVAWTAADLKKLLPPMLREFVMEAAASLTEAGELWALRAAVGKSRYWVFSKALQVISRPMLIPADRSVPTPAQDTGEAATTQRLPIVGPAVHAAYARWRQASGSSLMAISELHKESNLPLRVLHEWLLSEAKAQRAELSQGDWSLASEEVRQAALYAQGLKFIRVRLQETV